MSILSIQHNVSLQPFNTLAVPANARWFADVTSVEQLHEVCEFIQQQQCSLLLLGDGSNIVLADDFPGLCVKISITGRCVEKETNDHVFLSVAAGESWHDTVMSCVDKHYYGIENLALIPGCVGAAPIQNIGAYGVELEQCFSYLEAIDRKTGELVTLNKSDCQFSYRDSLFKQSGRDQFIIIRVVLVLSKTPRWVIEYPALKEALGMDNSDDYSDLTISRVADTVIAIRKSKLPDPAELPNAGSFFKNPIVSAERYQTLIEQWPDLIAYPQRSADHHITGYKLAAGWLLEKAGWKGKMINGICMHQQQALVLTNPNRLAGQELLAFVSCVQADIQQRYQLTLEVEPRIYQS